MTNVYILFDTSELIVRFAKGMKNQTAEAVLNSQLPHYVLSRDL